MVAQKVYIVYLVFTTMDVSRLISPYSEGSNSGNILAPPCGSCTCTCCCSSALGIPEIVMLSTYNSVASKDLVASAYPSFEEEIGPHNTVKTQETISPSVVSEIQVKGFGIGMAIVFTALILLQFVGSLGIFLTFFLYIFLISFAIGIIGYPIFAYIKIDKSFTRNKRLVTSLGLFFKSLIFIIVGGILQIVALGAVSSIL